MIKISFSAIKLSILVSAGLFVASLNQSTLAQGLVENFADETPAIQSPATQASSEVQPVAEPGWYPYVIARGADRQIIESTPIELRPYRPFHFYGNSVRRSYYRGSSRSIR